jgi:S-DNA-T family DNA segregation ATPase FtsK/SpoIIIE
VPSAKTSFRRAVAAHREALGLLAAVRDRLERLEGESQHGTESEQRQTELARRLGSLAGKLASSWLGQPWSVIEAERFPVERDTAPGRPTMIRIADAEPVPGAGFPVVVPLTGVGHLAIDRDARDPAVAGLLRSVLTRLLASFPAGTMRILAVDGGALGAPLAPFNALVPAGVMSEPVTDLAGLKNVLEEAEEQVRAVQAGENTDPDVIVIACVALPPDCGRTEFARIAALAHAGSAARVHLVLAGYPPPAKPALERAPRLEFTTQITSREVGGQVLFHVGDPPRDTFGAERRGLNTPVVLDTTPPDGLIEELSRHIAQRAESEGALTFDDLVPERLWQESSVSGLRTVVGRVGRGDAVLALDDATPHWLVSGRTGSGKTVFLLDALYALAARYSPDELAMFLLDFKEGVSFTEFIPTEGDPTWIPHARTVGVESDRQYGVAVLQELVREMNRRAAVMKQSGVTKLSDLRMVRRDVALPRIVAVIDEFHVLFQGKDQSAKSAAALLEEVARKGRSYGVHLILASQSVTGMDALLGKGSTVFGQFGMRIALSGGGAILGGSKAADALPTGQVILNDAGGAASGNRRARVPYADPNALTALRHRIWELRTPGSAPPAVFAGYAENRIEDDLTYARLTPKVKRRTAYIGRAVDVGLPAAGLTLDATPGRNLAVLGTSAVGADILSAAALGLARQHAPGTARFLLAGLAAPADDVVDDLAATLKGDGHECHVLELAGYRGMLASLATVDQAAFGRSEGPATYLVVFGADVGSAVLKQPHAGSKRNGLDDLRAVLRDGPLRGVHVLGWWRGVRRFVEDLGTGGKEDVAGLVALNVRGSDLSTLVGNFSLEWSPRPNRALFIDRHEDITRLVVPFVRAGRFDDVD